MTNIIKSYGCVCVFVCLALPLKKDRQVWHWHFFFSSRVCFFRAFLQCVMNAFETQPPCKHVVLWLSCLRCQLAARIIHTVMECLAKAWCLMYYRLARGSHSSHGAFMGNIYTRYSAKESLGSQVESWLKRNGINSANNWHPGQFCSKKPQMQHYTVKMNGLI